MITSRTGLWLRWCRTKESTLSAAAHSLDYILRCKCTRRPAEGVKGLAHIIRCKRWAKKKRDAPERQHGPAGRFQFDSIRLRAKGRTGICDRNRTLPVIFFLYLRATILRPSVTAAKIYRALPLVLFKRPLGYWESCQQSDARNFGLR